MLTPAGKVMTAVAAVLLIAGTLLYYPELIAIGLGGLLSMIAAAGWMLVRPVVTVVRQISPTLVAEGEQAQGVLILTNTSHRWSPPMTAVEQLSGHRVEVPLPSLGPGAEQRRCYDLPTSRRGVYQVGPLTIGHSDPLRLMHSAGVHARELELTVHPKVHPVASFPIGHARDAEGPTSSNSPQGGIAFHTIRDYEPGDPPQQIHWRSTARLGTLMVRHNVTPHEPRLLVVLDTSPQPYDNEAFEDAIRVTASVCVAACDAGHRLELRTTAGETCRAARGRVGRVALLDFLAAVERRDSDAGLRSLLMMPRAEGTSLGIVTGLATEDGRATVAKVRRNYQLVTMVQVGADAAGRPTGIDGVRSVGVATSAEFATIWKPKVLR
jgi:uncharacterized protein (DUF58 family)